MRGMRARPSAVGNESEIWSGERPVITDSPVTSSTSCVRKPHKVTHLSTIKINVVSKRTCHRDPRSAGVHERVKGVHIYMLAYTSGQSTETLGQRLPVDDETREGDRGHELKGERVHHTGHSAPQLAVEEVALLAGRVGCEVATHDALGYTVGEHVS